MRDILKDHEHEFDDCKCCGIHAVCDCGFTQYELSLEKDLKERDEDARRLKAQMKLRQQDYVRTISDLAERISALWLQIGSDHSRLDKENENEHGR